jgi:hypothetical protein
MEDFQSFAKFHEDLMVPGEEPRKRPRQEAEGKEPRQAEKAEKESPREPGLPDSFAGEKTEETFLFEEKAPKEAEEEVFPEGEEKVEEEPSKQKETARKRERRGPSPLLFVLVIVLLLIFGLFYLWTEMKSGGKLSPYLEGPIQRVQGVWDSLWGTEREGLTVGDLTGYEERIGDLSIFVIEGKISNQSRYAKKHVKVKVVIFDQEKVKMAEKEAIGGRVFSREELKGQGPAFFKGEMAIKPQTEKEMVIPAGKVAPFMVIFRDPLSQAKEFKVEIMEAPNL